jgi:hypothetical protein
MTAKTKPGTTRWLYEQSSSAEREEQDTCSAYLLGVAGAMDIAGFTYENPPKMAPTEWAIPLGAFDLAAGDYKLGLDTLLTARSNCFTRASRSVLPRELPRRARSGR